MRKNFVLTLIISLFATASFANYPNDRETRTRAFQNILADEIRQTIQHSIQPWNPTHVSSWHRREAQRRADSQTSSNKEAALSLLALEHVRINLFTNTFRRLLNNWSWSLNPQDPAFAYFNQMMDLSLNQRGNFGGEGWLFGSSGNYKNVPREAAVTADLIASAVTAGRSYENWANNKDFLNHLYWNCSDYMTRF